MSTAELRKDAEELRNLLSKAERPKVKDILSIELRKLETEIIRLEEAAKEQTKMEVDSSGETTVSEQVPPPKISKSYVQTVQEKTYAWDQSDKFMKIYASLQNVQTVPKENITCEFKPKSFKLRVNGVNNKNHEWHVSNLLEQISPADSYYKVKTDTVLVMLKKREQGKTWAYVTERENKAKQQKKPNVDDSKDPNESLMEMLKQMYDEGDDEMKRTITKAWSQSRDKQQTE